ncbi:hypothetical protein [Gordoniibacillus kamchatkensis]|uniref:hypothetical protein n=1 Tax=Gordoniibacillus kamchatkensis TaxID=1590651 RepID=UPI000A9FF760
MGSWFRTGRKKALFFDMNNTLVDRRQCFHAGFVEVLGNYTARWDAEGAAPAAPEEALACLQGGMEPPSQRAVAGRAIFRRAAFRLFAESA